ncbi:hypothetical protein OsI_00046 [Oryza sativa Indica Group]|uniref:Uncharacterized protein n=1 Tax=Oryza sativa subsp. indica TaxID=39946 RepID=B8ACT0_ORYSI|nr:hypothetical protein OsI_00046 [Oryza sativa Indica Group]
MAPRLAPSARPSTSATKVMPPFPPISPPSAVNISEKKKSGSLEEADELKRQGEAMRLGPGDGEHKWTCCVHLDAPPSIPHTNHLIFFLLRISAAHPLPWVVSDKQLVKHLQIEVARLETELRIPDRASSSEIIIMERNRKIRQVEKEMEELKKQRDNAQSKLELQKKMGDNQPAARRLREALSGAQRTISRGPKAKLYAFHLQAQKLRRLRQTS